MNSTQVSVWISDRKTTTEYFSVWVLYLKEASRPKDILIKLLTLFSLNIIKTVGLIYMTGFSCLSATVYISMGILSHPVYFLVEAEHS